MIFSVNCVVSVDYDPNYLHDNQLQHMQLFAIVQIPGGSPNSSTDPIDWHRLNK